MKWLVVALVLLQTCWGSHPKTSGKLVLPNVGEWTSHMETKGFIQGDIAPSKDESASEEEEEYPDEMDESASKEEEEYPDEMLDNEERREQVLRKSNDEKSAGTQRKLVLPNVGDWNSKMETNGYIQGDITPSKDVSPSKEEEEYPDEMEVSPSKEEEEYPDEMLALPDNEERELLDVEEIAPSGEYTIVITKRSSKRGGQWSNGIIPYVIDRSVSWKTRQSINSAIADFKKYTCIRFVPRRRQAKYAIFRNKGKGTGCNSPIGVPKGRNVNTINLEEPGCQKHGTVLHEMCHTIGLHHEQTRVDRNRYVRFIKKNVEDGKFEANFQSKPNDPNNWQSFNTPYDYYSIMHYGALAFSRNGKRTIITTDKNVQWLIGTMDHMSPIDAKQINLMYKCPQWWTFKRPPAYKCVDKKKRCDLFIAKYKCPEIYDMCCESCRDGVKCLDYDPACKSVASKGACNYGSINYKFAKANCCKSCKGGGGSVTPKKRTRGRGSVTPKRRTRGRGSVTPKRRTRGRTCADKSSSCKIYARNGYCRYQTVKAVTCCRTCRGRGK